MGIITVDGIPFPIEIEGETPTVEEAKRIKKIVQAFQGEGYQFDEKTIQEIYNSGNEQVIAAFEKAKSTYDKTYLNKLLKEFGMEPQYEGLDILIDRDDAFIAGSTLGSIPGLKDLFKIKNLKNLPTNPVNITRAFGKAFFGGVFGSITGAQAYDIAQYLITGNEDYKPNFAQLNQDTKEAIFWESIGLLIPEVIPKLARATLDFSDPAVQKARRIAQSLGIELDIAAQSKIGQLVLKPLGILPFIGGGLRNSKGVRIKQLNNIFDNMLAKIAPTSKYTELGVSIFNTGVQKFKSMKNTSAQLWKEAFDLHKSLGDPTVLNANKLFGSLMDLGQGKILREFVGMTDNRGVIRSFDDLKESGWFRVNDMERLTNNAAVKDFFNWANKTQKSIIEQGGNISYEQLRQWNGKLNSYYNDIVNQGTQMNKEFAKILKSIKIGLDDAISPGSIDISKIADPELANQLINAHKAANNFTINFKTLFESPAANSFGVFVKNIFDTGLDITKKDIDLMLDQILKIKSPTTLFDLKTILGDKVFKDVAKEFVDRAFQSARGQFDVAEQTIGGIGSKTSRDKVLKFDPGALAKALGFDIRNLDERGKFLLKEAGIDPQFLRNFIDYGAFETGIKIGDPSSYLQRSAQIKGLQPFIRGIVGSGAAVGAGVGLGAGPGFAGLLGLMISRYGLTKVLGNPNLAKAANIVFDPARQSKITNVPFTKLPLGPRFWQRVTQDIFDLHLRENPGEQQQLDVSNMLNDLRDSFDKNSTEYQFYNNLLNGLNLGVDSEPLPSIIDQDIQLKERLDEDKVTTQEELPVELTSFNIPTPDENFQMASVVPSMPDPNMQMPQQASGVINPNTLMQMDQVGLPLFEAKGGGIASLMNRDKPKQMVA